MVFLSLDADEAYVTELKVDVTRGNTSCISKMYSRNF